MNNFRDWVDIVFKVVLAVVGVIIGYYFSFEKQQNDDIKLVIDLSTDTGEAKRSMGVAIAEDYVQKKRIPESMLIVIYKYVNQGKDQNLQNQVNQAVSVLEAKDQTLQQAVVKANSTLPVRIYFHIRQEGDRDAAEKIEGIIQKETTKEGSSIVIPGIERVKGSQSESELRCFKKAECESLGEQLVSIFKKHKVNINIIDLSKTYETSNAIRPRHFEAWFASPLANPELN
jgi:hypothetical protein